MLVRPTKEKEPIYDEVERGSGGWNDNPSTPRPILLVAKNLATSNIGRRELSSAIYKYGCKLGPITPFKSRSKGRVDDLTIWCGELLFADGILVILATAGTPPHGKMDGTEERRV
jgi:hypothetical protein